MAGEQDDGQEWTRTDVGVLEPVRSCGRVPSNSLVDLVDTGDREEEEEEKEEEEEEEEKEEEDEDEDVFDFNDVIEIEGETCDNFHF